MPLFGKKKPKAPKNFGDKHLQSAPQSIGQDSANEVFKVNYKDKYAMGGETGGYFKPNATMAPAKNAIAASRLAQGLGWGHIIPETHGATHDVVTHLGEKKQNVWGAVSKASSGEALQSPVFDTLNPHHRGPSTDTTKMKADGNAYDYSGIEMNDSLDLSKSNTQQQLNQLQWFDALIGNMDRHGANILVDPVTGNVTGIDNDLSFDDGFKAKDRQGNFRTDYLQGEDAKYLGLPEQIDAETAEKLLGLSNKKVKKLLNPKKGSKSEKMSPKELQQVYDRLALIKQEVQKHKDNGTLIQSWDNQTYQDSLNQTLTKGNWGAMNAKNYAQRHHLGLQEAHDTSVQDHWIKGRRVETTTPPQPVVQQPQPLPIPQPQPQVAQVPPPVPSRIGRPQLSNSSEGQPTRSLSSRVLDTPWANDFKRAKPKARV